MSEILPAFRKPSSWFGVFGPPGMPADIVARLNAEMDKALKAPDVKSRLDGVGLAVIGGTPAAVRGAASRTASSATARSSKTPESSPTEGLAYSAGRFAWRGKWRASVARCPPDRALTG